MQTGGTGPLYTRRVNMTRSRDESTLCTSVLESAEPLLRVRLSPRPAPEALAGGAPDLGASGPQDRALHRPPLRPQPGPSAGQRPLWSAGQAAPPSRGPPQGPP